MCTCLISLTGFVFLDRTEKLTGAYGIAYGTLRDAYGMLTTQALLETLTGCLRDAYGILQSQCFLFIFPPKEGRPVTEEGVGGFLKCVRS